MGLTASEPGPRPATAPLSVSEQAQGAGRGPQQETLYLHPHQGEAEPPSTWWSRYRAQLDDAGLSPTAQAIIDSDCNYLLEFGIHGDGPAGGDGWPETRVRRGLVMGAVQSGKTASMLGLAAKSLDAGVDAVVVLAGTRVALWRQTFERLTTQLDQPGPEPIAQSSRRTVLPSLRAMHGGDELPPLARLYALNGPQSQRMLQTRRPLLCVAMKNIHHIRALADTIRRHLLPAIEVSGRPFHLLVLDDEADDGSILDARVEQSVDPVLGDLKQIPRAIVDLWEERPHTGETASEQLYVTYVGYTATPQANFLQSDHNPLAPRDFVVALRTAYDVGTHEPRQTTYIEPQGHASYYTGGETYYRKLTDAPLVLAPAPTEIEAARQALLAFLTAGAVRLWREPQRLGMVDARSAVFDSLAAARASLPRPHTMLVHPSSVIDDQFDAAAVLVQAAGAGSREAAMARVRSGNRDLPVEQLIESLTERESDWLEWLDAYQVSAAGVATAFSTFTAPDTPGRDDWPAIRDLLQHQVIPGTRIAIVNSDPAADDRPSFDPVERPDGWGAQRDLCTIFVSGNVMSRGITLEGLATTLFMRRSDEPMADTQMQMQRWFGYRGRDLELCRVFVPRQQQDLFAAYHEADEALRRDVIQLMNENPTAAPTPQVLQGRNFAATGKLANLRNVPLCPGAFPFVRLMNTGRDVDPNGRVVADAFSSENSADVTVNGTHRGRVLSRTYSLSETADLLDQLTYTDYRPGTGSWEARRWDSLAAHAGLAAGDGEGLQPLYRPGEPLPGDAPSEVRRDCPYAIAAYLRLWKACLTRHARGLVPTDDPRTPWSMLDLATRQHSQPRFYVGIRYGSGDLVTEPPLASLPFDIRMMRRGVVNDQLAGTWGTRNPGSGVGRYLGDGYFDYHVHHGPPPVSTGGTTWRPVGAPGLVLFHVIDRGPDTHPTIAVGLSIPLGGPDQFAARGPQ